MRREDLVEVGRRIRLKRNIALLTSFLENGIDGHCFEFYVVSAAPEDVVHSALAGIVPPDRIIATRFVRDMNVTNVSRTARTRLCHVSPQIVSRIRHTTRHESCVDLDVVPIHLAFELDTSLARFASSAT